MYLFVFYLFIFVVVQIRVKIRVPVWIFKKIILKTVRKIGSGRESTLDPILESYTGLKIEKR